MKDKELREKYQEALESEVDISVEKLSNYRKSSTSNVESVRKALSEWEEEVSRVARDVIGKKRIVCGRSVRWWDEELREMVIDRRACHKRVKKGNKEAWSEYCMKCKLLKEKIREKSRIQNESYMQSINKSYKKNKNEFWKCVHSKQSNGSKKIQLLRDDTYNCSVSNTKDELRVLKEHYQKLGKERHVEAFDSDWKIRVQTKIKGFEHLSEHIKIEHLDRKISNI